ESTIEKLNEKSKEIQVSTTGLGAWAPSRIKSLTSCPLQFLLKSVIKVSFKSEMTEEDIKNDPARFFSKVGTAAHLIIELMANGKTYEEAYEETKLKHFEDVTPYHWNLVEELEDNIRHFHLRIERFGVENPIDKIEPETMYALDMDWKPVFKFSKNAYFRGIIDMPVRLKNRDALLIDHKRGGSAQYGIRMHEFQLKAYSLMYCAANKDIRGVVPMIHYIQEGSIAKGDYYPRDRVLEEFSKTIDSAIYGAVEQVQEFGKFKHKRGNTCQYCEFQDLCKGGARGTANHLQPIVEESKILFRS
ncbi:MAG TPA: PD-(D/E)XK nuclease family protein, partial [Methanosarcina sp.]|nr:PD-(D/E)XK nuclease family protein [Methanosarcina sp.]